MKKIILLLLIFNFQFSIFNFLHAQLYVGVHGGVTLPQGLYAESRMSDNEWMFAEGHQLKAGAGRGWDAGLDISFALPFHPNLEIALTADFTQSTSNRDIREYYELSYARRYSQCSRYEMRLPYYRNIPIFLGLRYCYPATIGIDIYGEALIGINRRTFSDWLLTFTKEPWTPQEEIPYPEYNNIDIRSYTPVTTFAFRLGAGFILKKKYTIGASFQMLGKAPLAWDRTVTTRYDVYGNISEYTNRSHTDYTDLRTTLVLVQLGYRLNPFAGARHVQDW
jgi:hypothetical protein